MYIYISISMYLHLYISKYILLQIVFKNDEHRLEHDVDSAFGLWSLHTLDISELHSRFNEYLAVKSND